MTAKCQQYACNIPEMLQNCNSLIVTIIII